MRVFLLLVLAVLAAADARFNTQNAKLADESFPPISHQLKAGDFRGKSVVDTRPELGPSSENRRASGTPMEFVFTFEDGVPEMAKTVSQQAADVWSKAIVDHPPIPVHITVAWGGLPERFLVNPRVCGAPIQVEGYDHPVLAASPLAEKILGVEVGLNNPQCDSAWDGHIRLSSNHAFHYGAPEDIANDEFDFFSLMLHSLGHVMGIASLLNPSTGEYEFGFPSVMDLQMHARVYKHGPAVPYITASRRERVAMAATNDMYWFPKQDLATKLNFGHLDGATYPRGNPNSLMTTLGRAEVIRDPGNIVLNILNWSGYTTYKDDFSIEKDFVATDKYVHTFAEKQRVIKAKVQFSANPPSLYAVQVRHALGPKNKWVTVAFRSGSSFSAKLWTAEYTPVKQIRVRVLQKLKKHKPVLKKIVYTLAAEEY